MKRTIFIWIAAIATATGWAQIPADYTAFYRSLIGRSGEATILSAIYTQINSHTDVGYDGLYNVYPTSDLTGNNNVWDIYSTCTWTHGQKKCGSYSKVCDCYNREHSVPQSWFGEARPMKSDAFHVYPTDGKVNGQRSNFPYGECSGGTSLGGNALGKLGTSTFSDNGTSYASVGRVFEPVDQYKGDLARTYFYMVACYYNKNFTQSTEGTKVFTYSSSKAGLTPYAKALFMKWTRNDTVSTKERDRQEAIYAFQHNRNPFIDCPILAEYIWGNKAGQAITQADLENCGCIPATGTALEVVEEANELTPVIWSKTEDGVQLFCLPENSRIMLFDAQGRLLTEETANSSDHTLACPNGFYMILISHQNHTRSIKVIL